MILVDFSSLLIFTHVMTKRAEFKIARVHVAIRPKKSNTSHRLKKKPKTEQ